MAGIPTDIIITFGGKVILYFGNVSLFFFASENEVILERFSALNL